VATPERVGRVANIHGTVSYHPADATQWSEATLNYPVTQGSAYWSQPDAQALLEISSSLIALSGSTELDVNSLDPHTVTLTAPQGEIYLHLNSLAAGETWTVTTPRGQITLHGNGRYGITAGDTQHPTIVTVLEGAADVEAPAVSLHVGQGQMAVVEGTDGFTGRVTQATPDAFVTTMAEQDRAFAQATATATPGVTLPAACTGMPGVPQLSRYGDWRQSAQYGAVWYPRVAAGWVPYREGHWAYVQPWGWTWVDNAPWGFAPFHYGRWAQIDGAWGWIPVAADVSVPASVEPVYAPALVTFYGDGPDPSTLALGAAAAGVIAWAVLGPREPFYPWWHARPEYVRDVNVFHIRDVTNIVNIYNEHHGEAPPFPRGRPGVTVVPAGAMTGSRPIAGEVRPEAGIDPAHFHPFLGAEPVRPGPETRGLTPGVAAALGLGAGVAAGLAARHAAPGPRFEPGRPGTAPIARPTTAPSPGAPSLLHPGERPAGVPEITPRPPGAPGGPAGGPGHEAPLFARPGDTTRPAEPIRPGELVGPPTGGRPGDLVRPAAPARPVEPARPAEPPRPAPPAFHPPAFHPPTFHPPAFQPPAEGGFRPPAGGGFHPPPGGGFRPPAGGGFHPPAGGGGGGRPPGGGGGGGGGHPPGGGGGHPAGGRPGGGRPGGHEEHH
jgi:hypothetical protein